MLGKGWIWKCPEKNCENRSRKGREPSQSRIPKPYGVARRFGKLHMRNQHPGLDPDTVIIEKVE